MRIRLEYFETATPLAGVPATSVGVAIVFQPDAVLRWIRAWVPSWAGVTVPRKRTRWPRAGVPSPSRSVTLTRTGTRNSALVEGGDVFASSLYRVLTVGVTVKENAPVEDVVLSPAFENAPVN